MLTGGGFRGRDGVDEDLDKVDAFDNGCGNVLDVGDRITGRDCVLRFEVSSLHKLETSFGKGEGNRL